MVGWQRGNVDVADSKRIAFGDLMDLDARPSRQILAAAPGGDDGR